MILDTSQGRTSFIFLPNYLAASSYFRFFHTLLNFNQHIKKIKGKFCTKLHQRMLGLRNIHIYRKADDDNNNWKERDGNLNSQSCLYDDLPKIDKYENMNWLAVKISSTIFNFINICLNTLFMMMKIMMIDDEWKTKIDTRF